MKHFKFALRGITVRWQSGSLVTRTARFCPDSTFLLTPKQPLRAFPRAFLGLALFIMGCGEYPVSTDFPNESPVAESQLPDLLDSSFVSWHGVASVAPTFDTRTLSVFGNGDGEIGDLFADGTKYTKDVIAFASNDFKLGTLVTVTTPDGKKLTARVKDRMNRRFTGKRIDATIGAWKALTDKNYGLIRKCKVEAVRG